MSASRLARRNSARRGQKGFTLLELLLATLISTLTIAMLASAMGLSLRLWEKRQGRESGGGPAVLADLASTQIATLFHAEASGLTSGGVLCRGDRRSLVMLTSTTLKAATRGGPAIVRYAFDEANKRLYYAETPFAPGALEAMTAFVNADPSKVAASENPLWTDLEDFELRYVGENGTGETWIDQDKPPRAILARIAGRDGKAFVRAASPASFDFQAKVRSWTPGAAR